MHSQQRIWQYFQQHRVASIAAGHFIVVTLLGAIVLSSMFGDTLLGAFAQSPCSSGDMTYMVVSGDTLGAIATRYHATWQHLASYNKIANPNIIYVAQHICIPGVGNALTMDAVTAGIRGAGNFFPYGQCTWWAAQRYYQFHKIYVPWRTQADAWQWSARAQDFRWTVSTQPVAGSIIDLQPWVQGAYGLGHVAFVEKVLDNGHVIASNLNWGMYPAQITSVEFAPGPGVTFIYA